MNTPTPSSPEIGRALALGDCEINLHDQGSGDAVQNQAFCSGTARRVTSQAEAAYQTLLAEGVAPEEARIVLPHNLMTTVVWTGSLLFWARVCNQRLDSHAQLAAQELAKKIAAIVQPLFPVSWKELVHA